MTQTTFGDLLRELNEACEFLRSFALGHRGFTQQDGVAGMGRVKELCDQMLGSFGSSEHRKATAVAVATARNYLQSAQDRLDLLRG